MGRHIDTLTPDDVPNFFQIFWISLWSYNVALCLTKISILLGYIRIFPMRQFRIICWSVMGVVAVWGSWTILGMLMRTFPLSLKHGR